MAVPGLALGAAAWQPTLQHLPRWASRTVLLPGYGEPADRHEPLDPVTSSRRVVERLGDDAGPVVLLGHSASCQVVAEAAVALGGRVRGVVLVGPTTDPRAASWPVLVQRWLRTALHERPGQVPVLARSYARTGLRTGARAMDGARRHPIDVPLGRLGPPPVLVLRGRHDRICPEDWAGRLVDAAPAGSRAVTLPVGAHMVPLTHGAAVAEAVRDHLGAQVLG